MDNDQLKRTLLWAGIIVILLLGRYPWWMHNLLMIAALGVWAYLVHSLFPSAGDRRGGGVQRSLRHVEHEGPYRPPRLLVWGVKLKHLPRWVWLYLLLAAVAYIAFLSSLKE
jgi:hypothetical protein